jgi:hypothetical protein
MVLEQAKRPEVECGGLTASKNEKYERFNYYQL